jgi:hypothetical protein
LNKNTLYRPVFAVILSFFIFQIMSFLNPVCFYPSAQAQSTTTFRSQDEFHISACNGTVGFAVNGTYSTAMLQNDFWIFTNLHVNGDAFIKNFSVSVQNCNITIDSFHLSNATRQTLRFNYHLEGVGKQVFNFGLGPINKRFASTDWSVITRNNGHNVFLAEGRDFTISQDGTLTIAGLTGNVSIIRWGFSDVLQDSNLSFVEQNSVAITVAALLAIIVAMAVIIKVKSRRNCLKNDAQASNRASNLKQLWRVPFW